MSPALNRSSAIWCFECGDAIEIHSKVLYMGLPQTDSTIPHPHVVVCAMVLQVCSCGCPHKEVYEQHLRGKKHLRVRTCSLTMSATVFTLVSFLHIEHVNCQPKARYVYAREYTLNYNSQCILVTSFPVHL